jgi:hypothetical protein
LPVPPPNHPLSNNFQTRLGLLNDGTAAIDFQRAAVGAIYQMKRHAYRLLFVGDERKEMPVVVVEIDRQSFAFGASAGA